MRELKFRAWDKEKKKYLLPEEQGFVILPTKPSFGVTIPFQSECYPNETLDIDCVDWSDADLLMGRYELEQYTGLKDNNGKEIYEGDIVRYFDVEDHISEAIIRFGNPPIPYTNDDGTLYLKGFYLDWLRTHNDEDFTDDEWERLNDLGGDYEVIGNIHENPELLGGD